MNEHDKITLNLIKGEIERLPELDRLKIGACADQLRGLMRLYGRLGTIALAQVSAEAQAGVL